MAKAQRVLGPVVLTLTEEEIDTLRVVLHHIGGDPKTSPRKHAAAIEKAIEQVAVTYREMISDINSLTMGNIYFKDYPDEDSN